MQLSLAAHEHKMTLNDFILRVLEDKIKESDYQFENGTKPQLLNETELLHLKRFLGLIFCQQETIQQLSFLTDHQQLLSLERMVLESQLFLML